MSDISYSVIVPCYNTQEIFDVELARIQHVFESELKTSRFEVIIVDDGSPDPQTLPFLKRMHDKYPFVTLVELGKNTGQANAQLAAMHFVHGDIVCNLDDDMQTDPGNIPILLSKLEEGYDVVLGKYVKKRHNVFRRLLTRMDDKFETSFLGKPKDLSFTSSWVARRYVIDKIKEYRFQYSFMEGLFLRTTKNIANVSVEHKNRVEGKSGYTFRTLFKLWSNFTNFTIGPLRIAGVVGAITVLIGLVILIYTVVKRLTDPDIPQGYSALMCVILLFSGVILVTLGIMGEYIGRIFMCINETPQYVVRNVFQPLNPIDPPEKKDGAQDVGA